jgi:predicted nucleotide-binding protein (sugar kinase/HSP70/actin superfamily)
MMSQTGGGCRASNYIHLLRKALKKAGMGQIPVISVNLSGLEKNSGFKLTLPLIRRGLASLCYGDLLMLLSNQTRPYEVNKGESKIMVDKWTAKVCGIFEQGKGYSAGEMKKYLKEMVDDFSTIKLDGKKRIKVGIVGEIFVKYSALANNGLEEFLHEQDCEVMLPGILGFMLFKVDNRIEDINIYGGSKAKQGIIKLLFDYLVVIENHLQDALKGSKFIAPARYSHLKELIKPVIGYGCKMGEGWLLTAEMMELIEAGYDNIVCAQPFGCLPNHIVGKGMIRKLRNIYPDANIVPVDYDASATKVNQENRIKLMIAVAKENMVNREKKKG